MIKGVTHAHLGPIWYHSEPSDVPYSPNQSWTFFAVSYSKPALTEIKVDLNGLIKTRVLEYYLIIALTPMCSFFFFLVRLVSWVGKRRNMRAKGPTDVWRGLRARLSKHTWEWVERTFSNSHYKQKFITKFWIQLIVFTSTMWLTRKMFVYTSRIRHNEYSQLDRFDVIRS